MIKQKLLLGVKSHHDQAKIAMGFQVYRYDFYDHGVSLPWTFIKGWTIWITFRSTLSLFFLLTFCDMMSWRYRFNPFHTIQAVKKKTQFHIVSMAPGGKWLQWPLWKAFHRACSWWVDSRRPKWKKTWANLNTVLVLDDVQIPLSLGIQSYSQMMIGVSNHLLSIVFRFHETILRFGESGSLGYTTCYWIDIFITFNQQTQQLESFSATNIN